jgi:excisionase family DNA binding protein
LTGRTDGQLSEGGSEVTQEEFQNRIGLKITADEFAEIKQAYMSMPRSVDLDAFVKFWTYEGGIQQLFDKRMEIIVSLKEQVQSLGKERLVERKIQAQPEKQVFSRKEAAEYLGIHINTIDKCKIPRLRIGGRILFRRVALEKYLRDNEQKWKPEGKAAACGK